MKNIRDMSLSLFWNPKTIVLHSIAVYKTFRSFDFNDLENTARGTNKGIPVEKFFTNNIGVRSLTLEELQCWANSISLSTD